MLCGASFQVLMAARGSGGKNDISALYRFSEQFALKCRLQAGLANRLTTNKGTGPRAAGRRED